MNDNSTLPRWAPYPTASRYSGLSSRLLEDLVKDELVISSLVRRPGCTRGVRLIDLRSLDSYIENGIGSKSDVSHLTRSAKGKRRGSAPSKDSPKQKTNPLTKN